MPDEHLINSILSEEDPTITSVVSPLSCGSANDFYSNGDYWWPDPDKPDGLPYIRRDGLTNPGNFTQHRLIMLDMVSRVEALYQDGGECAIRKLNSILRTFFVDKKSRMNPSLRFSQAIPGICEGRSIGLIDTLHLIDIPFLLEKLIAKGLAEEDVAAGVKDWFNEYASWLWKSDFGRSEAAERNNHSITLHVQLAAFSLFSPERSSIRHTCIEFFKTKAIGEQMAADGSLPEELARTKPYSYSVFAMDNIVNLAQIITEEDLWTYRTADGRSLIKGVEFITPFIADKSRWSYAHDVLHWDELPVKASFLLFAGRHFNVPEWVDLWNTLPAAVDIGSEVYRNTAVKLPELYF